MRTGPGIPKGVSGSFRNAALSWSLSRGSGAWRLRGASGSLSWNNFTASELNSCLGFLQMPRQRGLLRHTHSPQERPGLVARPGLFFVNQIRDEKLGGRCVGVCTALRPAQKAPQRCGPLSFKQKARESAPPVRLRRALWLPAVEVATARDHYGRCWRSQRFYGREMSAPP